MVGIWIYQNDKESYVSLMNEECGGPVIRTENEEKLQVDFCSAAMQVWVECGFWYGWE